MFGREKKRTEAITDFYEQCFEDFKRKAHNSIKSLSEKNEKIKEEYAELEQKYKDVLSGKMPDYEMEYQVRRELEERIEKTIDYIENTPNFVTFKGTYLAQELLKRLKGRDN